MLSVFSYVLAHNPLAGLQLLAPFVHWPYHYVSLSYQSGYVVGNQTCQQVAVASLQLMQRRWAAEDVSFLAEAMF